MGAMLAKLDKIPGGRKASPVHKCEPPYTKEGGLVSARKDTFVHVEANANVDELEHSLFWENHDHVIAHDKVFDFVDKSCVQKDKVFAPVDKSYVHEDGKILTFLLDDRGYKALVKAKLAKAGSKAKKRFDDFQKKLRNMGFAGIEVNPGMGSKTKGYNRYYRMSQEAHVKALNDKIRKVMDEFFEKTRDGILDDAAQHQFLDAAHFSLDMAMISAYLSRYPPPEEEAAPLTRSLAPTAAASGQPATTEQRFRSLQSAVESEKERQDQQQVLARETCAPSPIYRALGSGGSSTSSTSSTSSGALDLGTELGKLLTTLQEAIQKKVWQMPKVDTDGGTGGGTDGHDSGYVGGESDGYDSDPIAEGDGEAGGEPRPKKLKRSASEVGQHQ
jgi:hypothetical protein